MIFRFKKDDGVSEDLAAGQPPVRRFGIRELLDSATDRIEIKGGRANGAKALMGFAALAVALSALPTPARADHPAPAIEIAKADIVQRLKAQGYTEILMLPSTSAKGEWVGSVFKDGARVSVTVNAEGQIIHR